MALLIGASFIPNKSAVTNGLICTGLLADGTVHSAVKNRNKTAALRPVKAIDLESIGLLMGLFLMIGGITNMGVIDATAAGLARLGGGNVLAGCGSTNTSTGSEDTQPSGTNAETNDTATAEREVLRVGMECAYAPFNWTQDTDTTPDGSKAVPIYGSDYYAYGYDVAVAQMLAEEMDMDLEIHKVEWSSIGLSVDNGEYDCIIAGMGRTAERKLAYSFTEPYYYRDNCIVVKKGSVYENVTKLSELNGTGCKLTTQLGTGWIALGNGYVPYENNGLYGAAPGLQEYYSRNDQYISDKPQDDLCA